MWRLWLAKVRKLTLVAKCRGDLSSVAIGVCSRFYIDIFWLDAIIYYFELFEKLVKIITVLKLIGRLCDCEDHSLNPRYWRLFVSCWWQRRHRDLSPGGERNHRQALEHRSPSRPQSPLRPFYSLSFPRWLNASLSTFLIYYRKCIPVSCSLRGPTRRNETLLVHNSCCRHLNTWTAEEMHNVNVYSALFLLHFL